MTDRPLPGHQNDMSHADTLPLTAQASSVPPLTESAMESVAESRRSQGSRVAEGRDSRDARAAFRAMYDAHVDFVWRNLRRLGVNEVEVDDKTQEVFVIAHRRFGDFEERGHGPRAWLFQIVLRVASDARRHRKRHPVDPDGGIAQEHQSVPPPQTEALDRREQLDLLDRALGAIEVGRRAVLLLHEIEEMTAPEIAEVMGIPLNTVYSRLRVARGELEKAVEELRAGDAGDGR